MSSTTQADPHARHEDAVPAPDDPRKPDSPDDLTTRSWRYVLRKTWHEFSEDRCTDLAAALTYYAVLALFPAIVALVSLVGVVGDPASVIDTVLDAARPLVSGEMLATIEPVLREIAASDAAGFALVAGLLGALWSASGYVGAFGRAMNEIYEIREGRPFWKLRPTMLLVTLLALALAASVLLMLVVSGPVAEAVGDAVGLGEAAQTAWAIAKWPVLAGLVVLVVALLYYATPNVKQPRFRWMSIGAFVAIATWVVASVAFSFYVANFSSYNSTYGSLAGVVVALLFLWITNLALLFGAELDAEVERGRELQAGIAAEEEIQLPARDTRGIEKAEKREAEDVEVGRRIREHAASRQDAGAHPADPDPEEGR